MEMKKSTYLLTRLRAITDLGFAFLVPSIKNNGCTSHNVLLEEVMEIAVILVK